MIQQFTVKLTNRPGALEKMVSVLADSGVDIKALEVSERGGGDHGISHFIVNNVDGAREALKTAGYEAELSEVVVVAMEDEVGGLARVLNALSSERVNIKHLYAFVTNVKGRSLAVFAVDEPRRVADLLRGQGLSVITRSGVVDAKGPEGEGDRGQAGQKVDALEYYLGGTYFW